MLTGSPTKSLGDDKQVIRRCAISTYKRLPRGKAKPHDEFKDWTIHALIWIRDNWRTALEFVAVAAVAFAIMIGASTYWHHRSQTAAENLYAAERLPAFSDEQIKKFEELVSDYSRTPAGQEAMMKLGNIYLEKKEYDKASDQFKKLAGRSRNHPILKIAAMHMLAATELTQGNAKEAAETYLKAAADPGNILSSNSRYHAALSFEKAGDLDRAAVLYKQIIEDTGKEENKSADLKIRDASEERLIWLMVDKKVQG